MLSSFVGGVRQVRLTWSGGWLPRWGAGAAWLWLWLAPAATLAGRSWVWFPSELSAQ